MTFDQVSSSFLYYSLYSPPCLYPICSLQLCQHVPNDASLAGIAILKSLCVWKMSLLPIQITNYLLSLFVYMLSRKVTKQTAVGVGQIFHSWNFCPVLLLHRRNMEPGYHRTLMWFFSCLFVTFSLITSRKGDKVE